jgi:hypothetical protein
MLDVAKDPEPHPPNLIVFTGSSLIQRGELLGRI